MMTPATKDQILRDMASTLAQDNRLWQAQTRTSVAGSLLSILAQNQVDLQAMLQSGLMDSYLSEASGTALDNFGSLLGLSRQMAQRAVDYSDTNFQIGIDPSFAGVTLTKLISMIPTSVNPGSPPSFSRDTNTIIIYRGLRLDRPGSFSSYTTTEDVVLQGGTTMAGAPVIASGLGASYNVPAGALTVHNLAEAQPALESIAKYLVCNNRMPISSGSNIQTDDNYRYLLSKQVQAQAAGNEIAIRLAALSVPGVGDIMLKRWTMGVGTFSVYVIGTSPTVSQGVLNAVYEAVRSVTAYPEKFTVSGPEYVGVKLNFALTVPASVTDAEKASLNQRCQAAIIDYVNNLPLGGTLIVNEIIQRIMDISESIIDVQLSDLQLGVFDSLTNTLKYTQPVLLANTKLQDYEKFYTTYNFITAC